MKLFNPSFICLSTTANVWTDSRSSDYNLSAMELTVSKDKDKSGGVLFPACQFKINKKTNEVEIEAFQNPWKMTNVMDRTNEGKK